MTASSDAARHAEEPPMNAAAKNPGDHDSAQRRAVAGRQRAGQARPEAAQPASAARAGGRRQANPYAPEYVVEVLINPQLRERNPGRPLTLCEVLEVGHGPRPGREPEPDLEPEAEP